VGPTGERRLALGRLPDQRGIHKELGGEAIGGSVFPNLDDLRAFRRTLKKQQVEVINLLKRLARNPLEVPVHASCCLDHAELELTVETRIQYRARPALQRCGESDCFAVLLLRERRRHRARPRLFCKV
jgi:hypothetical protein